MKKTCTRIIEDRISVLIGRFRVLRLQFAKSYRQRTVYVYNRIIFSGESKFQICHSDERVRLNKKHTKHSIPQARPVSGTGFSKKYVYMITSK